MTLLQKILHPRGRRYAGQPFDVSSRHSIQMVNESGGVDLMDPQREFVVVDHFYHESQYWRARVPLSGVQQIFGQAFNFSKPKTRPGPNGPELVVDHQGVPKRTIPGLNHVQCRFVFSAHSPIRLYPLGSSAEHTPHHELVDMIYSIEAVGPLGVRFNFRDAFMGNLISAHRLLSGREMVFERIVVENMYVLESPPLPLDEHKRRAALVASVLRSHRAAMNETYYLFRCFGTNNCTSTPLREIDRIADYRFLNRLGAMLYRLPIHPRLYLRLRGLDSDRTVRKLVRDQFTDFVNDPETIRRKRAYVRARTQALRALRATRTQTP
jgi:hypothetical protein